MSEETMTQAYGRKRTHLNPELPDGDTPFLARFAEVGDHRALDGGYDESAEVWVVRGQPLATGVPVAMETMTFTKVGGESQDSD